MKHICICIILFFQLGFSQADYSDQWKDIYSYNDVKDFTISENRLFAITQNALFIYNIETEELEKYSSINGLSGGTTSSVYYDKISSNIIIGYENGNVEIINEEKKVTPITGLRDNLKLVDKLVKGFYHNKDQDYLYGDFGIIEFDIEKTEFVESFSLGDVDNSYSVNEILVRDNFLFAATNNGLYQVSLDRNLKDFNNWIQITSGEISNLKELKDKIYFTKASNVYEIENPNVNIINSTSNILDLGINETREVLILTMSNKVNIHNSSTYLIEDSVDLNEAIDYSFTTTKAVINDDVLFLNSSDFGVLSTDLSDKMIYSEIHPEGPNRNDAFFVTAKNNNIYISYGKWTTSVYNFSNRKLGISIFNDKKWYNVPHSILGVRDITKIEIDPINPDLIYVPSYFNGVVLLEKDNITDTWQNTNRWNPESTNNGIQVSEIASFDAIISHLALDNNDKLWVSSLFAKDYEFLSRYNPQEENWETHTNFSSLFNVANNDVRIINMFVSSDGTIYCGTHRNGLIVLREKHDENIEINIDNSVDPIIDLNEIQVLNTDITKGGLVSNTVSAVVADDNNRVWIGTDSGLVVYSDYSNLFKETKTPASTLIIEEDGIAREFLASTQINDIIIDSAGNKWFATEGAGVFNTSSDGQTTYNIFNSSNSPLPTSTILDLELDEVTGEIYMVTDNGTLIYDPKNEPFGTEVTSVVAYPNPAIRNQVGHENVTIVAKDGNGIPDGTNVKIIDVSGKLVYETNVSTINGSIGGKVVWNKTNLSGNSVVSGIYIVLLSNFDGSETTTTKIAIVN